jgi:hypothetical protein
MDIADSFRLPDDTKQAVLLSIRFPGNELPCCVDDAFASCGDRPANDLNGTGIVVAKARFWRLVPARGREADGRMPG